MLYLLAEACSCLVCFCWQPIANFLTWPLDKGTQVYAEKGVTSNAIWLGLTKYLNDFGCTLARMFTAPEGAA